MKNLCPECGDIHKATEPCIVALNYDCPECGRTWKDTWVCAVNGQCPECGAQDIEPIRTPQDCCNMEMVEAFETVLLLARARAEHHSADLATKTAIGLVTAYFLLKVKG